MKFDLKYKNKSFEKFLGACRAPSEFSKRIWFWILRRKKGEYSEGGREGRVTTSKPTFFLKKKNT